MEYYGGFAASTSPLPNIYRQHRRHKSSSPRGGGTAGTRTAEGTGTGTGVGGASSTSTGSTGTAGNLSKESRKSTSTRTPKHARPSPSSEFSSGSRNSHDSRPPLTSSNILSRVPSNKSNSSGAPPSVKSASGKPERTPNKIKRKSFSRSKLVPPLPTPLLQAPQQPLSPCATSTAATAAPPPISSPTRPPPPTPTLIPPLPVALPVSSSPSAPATRRQTSPSAATSRTPPRLEASVPLLKAGNIAEIQQYHPPCPASPTFPSAYLPNLKFLPSHPPRTSSVSASVSASATIGAPTPTPTTEGAAATTTKVTTTGQPGKARVTSTSRVLTREIGSTTVPSSTTTAITASTSKFNAGGGIEDQNESAPPPPPPKTPPGKSPKPDPRMLANAGKQVQPTHQKQLPALPPQANQHHRRHKESTIGKKLSPAKAFLSFSAAPPYAAPLPPIPRPIATSTLRTAAVASGSESSTAPTPSAGPHQYHSHPPTPRTGTEDRQQHHATMPPEPGALNPSTSSSTLHSQQQQQQHPPHIPLQPQALARFSVPFARTESVVSSASAATTLSSRTMQSSDPPSASTEDVSSNPFIVRNGRTLLNDLTLPYPLPVDLPELHRQSLRTLLLFQLFGGPVCSPAFQSKPPSRVLEVGCGSGFWSMMCHRYFVRHGHSNISFTGIDIAPLSQSGSSSNDTRPDRDMKWRFVQHDLRKAPWPFQDTDFDLIMVKDMSLATGTATQQSQVDEMLRILRPGGVLELWESDHTIRMLRPHVPTPLSDGEDEELDHASSLGAYVMTANTPLSAPLNNYLVEYNGWISKAFDARSISTVPCTTLGPMLLQEAEMLVDIRSRRLAVPLSEMRWEREGVGGVVTKDGKSYIETKGKSREMDRRAPLSAGQIAVRRTALLTVVQMIQSLEPVLRESSGKSQDEWDGWAGKMVSDLMGGGTSWGECLEVGAWWAKKRT
ncbi:putative sam binding domain-containing protein containing protein [Zalerion maritima]|uniref:Sam binding domain-containing protein containing protein n=1 Tax=Zalerion maritima TaxID=339359 RepID=A0AAD5RWG2_9PEZI|nr:putative sam binding domain-containing protein containing protein [Zalerion maritima]